MKKTLAILAIMAAAVGAFGGTNDVVTAYFTGYVYVPTSMTNAGDTGLTVSNAYLCFPASLFTIAAAQATGDVRQVMYSVVQEYYDSWTALSAGNRSASTPARAAGYALSGTNVMETINHALQTTRVLGAATLP